MILKTERLIVDNLQCEINLQQYECSHNSHKSCCYNKHQVNYTKNSRFTMTLKLMCQMYESDLHELLM